MVKLLEKIKKELPFVVEEYGYKSKNDFFEDAILRRLLELKRDKFAPAIKDIKSAMKKRGLREKDVLKDFEKFSHSK